MVASPHFRFGLCYLSNWNAPVACLNEPLVDFMYSVMLETSTAVTQIKVQRSCRILERQSNYQRRARRGTRTITGIACKIELASATMPVNLASWSTNRPFERDWLTCKTASASRKFWEGSDPWSTKRTDGRNRGHSVIYAFRAATYYLA